LDQFLSALIEFVPIFLPASSKSTDALFDKFEGPCTKLELLYCIPFFLDLVEWVGHAE